MPTATRHQNVATADDRKTDLVISDETMSEKAQSGKALSKKAISEKAVSDKTRLVLAAVVLVGLFAAAHATGVLEKFDAEGIRSLVLDAGPWGVGVFLLAFAIGPLVQLPGMVFVAASVMIYGQVAGGLLAWFGGVVAVATTFCTVRLVGGQPKPPSTDSRIGRVINRLISGLQDHPLRTVIALRTVAFLSPPINYALALSPIRYRDYMLGSALGLVAPMAVVVGVSGCFFS